MPESFENLLERVRGGDREALQVFIDRFGSRIRRRMHVKLGPFTRSIYDTDDALQEVRRRADAAFCSGVLHAQGLPQLLSWLDVTADRVVLNANRSSHREHAVRERYRRNSRADGAVAATGAQGDEGIEGRLAHLSDSERELLMELFGRGVPRLAAGQRLGLTPAALKRRLARLVTALRRRTR